MIFIWLSLHGIIEFASWKIFFLFCFLGRPFILFCFVYPCPPQKKKKMFDSRHISWPITIHIHTQLECGVYTATKVDPFLSFGPRACVVCNALWRVVTCFFASLSNWKRMSSFLDNQKRNKRYNNNNNLPKPPPPRLSQWIIFLFIFILNCCACASIWPTTSKMTSFLKVFFFSFFYLKFRCGSAACNDGVDAKKAVKRRNKKKIYCKAKRQIRDLIFIASSNSCWKSKKKKRAIIIWIWQAIGAHK